MLLSFLLPVWHLQKHLHVHSAYPREGWVLARLFYVALYLKTVMFASLYEWLRTLPCMSSLGTSFLPQKHLLPACSSIFIREVTSMDSLFSQPFGTESVLWQSAVHLKSKLKNYSCGSACYGVRDCTKGTKADAKVLMSVCSVCEEKQQRKLAA